MTTNQLNEWMNLFCAKPKQWLLQMQNDGGMYGNWIVVVMVMINSRQNGSTFDFEKTSVLQHQIQQEAYVSI